MNFYEFNFEFKFKFKFEFKFLVKRTNAGTERTVSDSRKIPVHAA